MVIQGPALVLPYLTALLSRRLFAQTRDLYEKILSRFDSYDMTGILSDGLVDYFSTLDDAAIRAYFGYAGPARPHTHIASFRLILLLPLLPPSCPPAPPPPSPSHRKQMWCCRLPLTQCSGL